MFCVLFLLNPAKLYRFGVVACAVATFAYTLTLTTITGGPCSPLKGLHVMQCLVNVALSQAVLNIASDFAILLLPIPTIISLNLKVAQKVSVACILAVGSGVIVCSIARLPYVLSLRSGSPNMTYDYGILGVWSVVEVNLGIVCGCAMRLKKLIIAYLPKLGLGSSRSRSRGASKMLPTGQSSGSRSYQLHSVQKGSVDPAVINDPYGHYDKTRMGKDSEDGSTDKILE